MFVRILYVWLNHKKIEVPVSFEEVYINGKGDDEEDIISELDKLIIKSFEEIDDIQKKEDCILEKMNLKEKWFHYLMLLLMIEKIVMISTITKLKK